MAIAAFDHSQLESIGHVPPSPTSSVGTPDNDGPTPLPLLRALGAVEDDGHAAVARACVSISDTLKDDFDVDATLGYLISACQRLVNGSEASIIMMDNGGNLRVVAGSAERKRFLDQYQVDHATGPSIDVFRSNQQTIEENFDADNDRWPAFAQLAQVVGYRALQSIPLRLRDETIGVLSIGETLVRHRPAQETSLLRVLADCTAIGIINQREYSVSNTLAIQLQTALTTRVLIEQAKGVVAARLGITIDEAFSMLRSHARGSNLKLNDVSSMVIDGSLPTHDLWPKKKGSKAPQ